jgi:hypothetical protein
MLATTSKRAVQNAWPRYHAVRLLSSGGRAPLPPAPRVLPAASRPPAPSSSGAAPAKLSGARPLSPEAALYARTSNRGPVSWPSLFLVTVAAASAVAFYSIERERRLEQAMGQVVSSESDGWTPRPDYLAKRKFVATQDGWFPLDDGYGARELLSIFAQNGAIHSWALSFLLFVSRGGLMWQVPNSRYILFEFFFESWEACNRRSLVSS